MSSSDVERSCIRSEYSFHVGCLSVLTINITYKFVPDFKVKQIGLHPFWASMNLVRTEIRNKFSSF